MTTLLEKALELFNKAIDALGTDKETELLKDAEKAFTDAGSYKDAETCRLLMENKDE